MEVLYSSLGNPLLSVMTEILEIIGLKKEEVFMWKVVVSLR